MHGYYLDGWDWFWMTFMMGFWVVLLGVAVYIAVKLAADGRGEKSPR